MRSGPPLTRSTAAKAPRHLPRCRPVKGCVGSVERRLLDWGWESATVKIESKLVMVSSSGLVRLSRGGGAAVVAALVLLFCLSSAGPAMSEPAACQGLGPTSGICAQPNAAGAVGDLLGFGEPALPTQWAPVQAGCMSPSSEARLVGQFHIAPSAPRAPPFSLN